MFFLDLFMEKILLVLNIFGQHQQTVTRSTAVCQFHSFSLYRGSSSYPPL